MPGPFKADAEDVQALATFLAELANLSRKTGVWMCIYGTTAVELPGGSTIEINRDKTVGDNWTYAVDTVVGY